MNFVYLKPQDSGERCDSRMAELSDGKVSVRFQSEKDFCFQATPFDICDYKKHDFEMDCHTGKTMFFLDYKTTGVGSAACGAPLPERYEVKDEAIGMDFDIVFKKEL